MKKKYKIVFACGAMHSGEMEEKNLVREFGNGDELPFAVWGQNQDGLTYAKSPRHEDDTRAACISCQCRRKAKRKESKFFPDNYEKTKRFGESISCHPVAVEIFTKGKGKIIYERVVG